MTIRTPSTEHEFTILMRLLNINFPYTRQISDQLAATGHYHSGPLDRYAPSRQKRTSDWEAINWAVNPRYEIAFDGEAYEITWAGYVAVV